MDIGLKIKRLREQQNISQEELALKVFVQDKLSQIGKQIKAVLMLKA